MIMYRILITREKQKDAFEYLKELPQKLIKDKLKKMRDNLTPVGTLSNTKINDYKNYLTEIIKYYSWIQIMPPSLMKIFFQNHPKISKLKEIDLEQKFKSEGADVSFSNMIISRMRYSNVARKKISRFLKAYGFNTCVYCNQAPIDYDKICSVDESNEDENMTEGTLDHFYNKNRYPFLCTSFFNLFPCCGTCNGPVMKGERQIGFYPYREDSENEKDSPFRFIFDIKDYGKFCSEEDVSIDFEEDPGMGDLILYKGNNSLQKYKEIFNIVKRYHKYRSDVCLAENRRKNNEITQKTLAQLSNGRLPLPTPSVRAEEILNINSLNVEDIHKRSLAKLLLDLGKNWGLI